jgi:hypothetical protein
VLQGIGAGVVQPRRAVPVLAGPAAHGVKQQVLVRRLEQVELPSIV